MKFCMRKSVPGLDELIIDIDFGRIKAIENQIQGWDDDSTSFILSCSNDVIDKLSLRGQEYKSIKSLVKKYPEKIKIRFAYYLNNEKIKNILDFFKEDKIPFFFVNIPLDYDTIDGFLSLGVTDIYIGNQLGFDIQNVAKKVHAAGASVRIYPNICQSSYSYGDKLTQFYVRPEDISAYENWVDVCELISFNNSDGTLYKIYAKEKKWWGPLKEIILGLDSDIDNRYIGPEFAWFRTSCRKRCLTDGSCKMCKRIEELSHVAEKIKDKKEKI